MNSKYAKARQELIFGAGGRKKVLDHTEEFWHCSPLKTRVVSTGPGGGDFGHGGFTLVEVEDLGGTAWAVDVRGGVASGPSRNLTADPDALQIMFGGDAELVVFAEALEWAAAQLRAAAEGMHPSYTRVHREEYNPDHYDERGDED